MRTLFVDDVDTFDMAHVLGQTAKIAPQTIKLGGGTIDRDGLFDLVAVLGGNDRGIALFAIGGVALALFIWRQVRLQRRDRALLDLRVFRSLNFS